MKKTVLLLFTLIYFCNLHSQEYQKHEFSVGALAGIASLKYDMAQGKSSSSFSGGVGFGYTYFFKKNMGLATGVEFAFYNAEVKLDDFSSSHAAFDIDEQKDFDFRYTLNNYKEKQNAFYLNIPIMLHYQFTDGEKMKFYGAGGFKVGLPINGKYKSVEGGALKTEGYFPHNGDVIDDIPFRGFGDFTTQQRDSEIKYKMAFNLALEVGAKWTLPKEMALYTGLYMDYGLNDVNEKSKNGEQSLVQYNQLNPEDHLYNGVATSSYRKEGGNMQPIVKKINTMAYGVKIRFAFGK